MNERFNFEFIVLAMVCSIRSALCHYTRSIPIEEIQILMSVDALEMIDGDYVCRARDFDKSRAARNGDCVNADVEKECNQSWCEREYQNYSGIDDAKAATQIPFMVEFVGEHCRIIRGYEIRSRLVPKYDEF